MLDESFKFYSLQFGNGLESAIVENYVILLVVVVNFILENCKHKVDSIRFIVSYGSKVSLYLPFQRLQQRANWLR